MYVVSLQSACYARSLIPEKKPVICLNSYLSLYLNIVISDLKTARFSYTRMNQTNVRQKTSMVTI